MFIRAILVNAIVNETIWSNESSARSGGSDQDTRLKFTHSLNAVRNLSTNVMSSLFDGRRDLKLDYMSPDLTKDFGYNFEGVLQCQEP